MAPVGKAMTALFGAQLQPGHKATGPAELSVPSGSGVDHRFLNMGYQSPNYGNVNQLFGAMSQPPSSGPASKGKQVQVPYIVRTESETGSGPPQRLHPWEWRDARTKAEQLSLKKAWDAHQAQQAQAAKPEPRHYTQNPHHERHQHRTYHEQQKHHPHYHPGPAQ